MATGGHALILFDLLRGILPEMGIGEFGKEVANEIAVERFVGVNVFGCHSVFGGGSIKLHGVVFNIVI